MTNWDITRQSLRRIEEQRPEIPLVCAPEAPPEAWTTEEGQGLDDKTLAYVIAARPAFDAMREATAQLAALFVLAAAGGRSAQDNPIFAMARSAQAESRDVIRSLRPSPQGAHHHHHLLACSKMLGSACDAASETMHKGQNEKALTLLQKALRQLHFAAAALPGFEVVALNQSCCAAHSASASYSPGDAAGRDIPGIRSKRRF
ncbi:hypothetical protein [Acidisoma silvae]|uniref:Uncharacterized protein n=1 Tax=Acidisoma silvae TaxID=2802396 RepID=A0A963YVE6_9PROT|nr:hypothetical protein [Acidisoma silvae]MCB8877509.1 hypothetical protein [Acidisoma silvae]